MFIESGVIAPSLSLADLEQLVRTHGHRLRNFLRRRVGNSADVDDLLQETCLEALRCRARFQGHSKPETWLFGIAQNLVRGHYKRSRLHPSVGTDEMLLVNMDGEFGEDPLDVLNRMQEVSRLYNAVDGLPEGWRSVLTLVFDEHFTYQQTATRLGIPVGTVRSRISRARAQLRHGGRPVREVHA